MKHFPPRCLLLGFLIACLPLSGTTLTNQAGNSIEVEILNIEPERIQIRLENGNAIWYGREQLSTESQQLISQIQSEEQSKFAIINELLGVPLLQDNLLWDDAPDTVAQRLNWRLESQTATQSSYRYYPPADFRILNSRPYACVLYGADDHADRISIVFANKGDFKFSDPPTEDEIEAMQEAIEDDEETLVQRLSDTLGEPEKQSFGTGRGIKERLQRWDWKGHAFLLASQEDEYVSLRIMSTEAADNKGRSEKLSDAKLRKLTTENIITRPNGDVLIGNIPMVNQGPKGYCVPATFERYLRYMQIPADMYLLAMAGQTDIGGGTSLSSIINSVDSYISSQSRSMKQLNEPIKVRTIQKYIDKGLPIIWVMFSSKEYNQYANQRSKERQAVTDWTAWAKASKSNARSTELSKDIMSAHACLITGYNKDTGEIAVSDSWGPSFNERWISAEQAEQVSQGSIYLISF
ncbi:MULTISPECIES: hypothetical protein [unclassified Lentimonas]|uniref:hypothetical protein n=1 Tax=unclassified Lentimonas TaxID=2630993 RepID=UPI001322067C|nr:MULTISPECIES: hypothetical protein [unclassified Lentimonas]CAA6692326.1 Unannotated [Lentimonas sp. CC10]CAA6694660.1 Unannotated [Lentimonas sp. CC19]CAA7071409.1 Unannotated [Lentimonas sp. CC11]